MTTIYSVKLIHPKHGIRKVETLATSLKEAEQITAELWASTHWKVFAKHEPQPRAPHAGKQHNISKLTMDTTEQLKKIKEECEQMLEFSERANVTNYLKVKGRPEAGWKSTITAIDYLSNDAEIFGENTQRGQAARSQINAIIAAWSIIYNEDQP